MKDSVLNFIVAHNIMLLHREAENFRPVEPGTYTHTTLPLGEMREGITNGVVSHMYSPIRLRTFEVQLKNMSVVLDAKQAKLSMGKAKAKQTKPQFDYTILL